jgi:thiol-disulfide isomerase/thioredoxin
MPLKSFPTLDGRSSAVMLQIILGLLVLPSGCKRETSEDAAELTAGAASQTARGQVPEGNSEQLLAIHPDDQRLQSTDDVLERIGLLVQQGMQQSPPDYGVMIRAGNLAGALLDRDNELDESAKRLLSAAFYNQACGLARKSDYANAIASLNKALKVGFADGRLVQQDTDLDGLRNDERFKKFLGDLAVAERAHLEAEVDTALAGTKPFPFSFELESIDGSKASLEQLRGAKVTVVDIWGTWCPPCRMEIPHFVDLHAELQDQGLQIIGVTYERGDKDDYIPKLKSYAGQTGIRYPLVLGDEATKRRIPDFRGFPTTLFLDGQGVVRAVTVGYHSKEVLKGIIERLMKSS